MAVTATTNHEVQTGGNDANGGGFDTAATFATDGAVSSANTASPVFSSASYTFVAGDVGAWLFLKSGTNSIPGWYQIASVATGQATLNATVGQAVLYPPGNGPTTATGCGTAASLSSCTWGVDYSQQAAPQVTYADLVIGVTTTQLTSAAHPFGQNSIGNVINVTAGTGFTVQRLVVSSVSGTTATCNASAGTASSTGGAGKLGGCFLTPGLCAGVMVGGNIAFVKSGTYSITSASTNVAAGCLSLPNGSASAMTKVIGYGSVRGDNGTKPLLQASGIATFTLIACGTASHLENLSLDGAGLTSSRGISMANTGSRAYRCKVANCTNNAFIAGSSVNGTCILCEATGCSGSAAFSQISCLYCVSHGNTNNGFQVQGGYLIGCVAAGNTGTTDGFNVGTTAMTIIDCVSYGNGRWGFVVGSTPAGFLTFINCLAVGNGSNGYDSVGAADAVTLYNCAGFNNTGGNTNANITNLVGFLALTADPFTNAAGNDFSLNNTAGGGASLRAAGIPGNVAALQLPGLSTLAYPDIGAAQHPDPVGGGGWHPRSLRGLRGA